jgi:prephenate dehydrogenase
LTFRKAAVLGIGLIGGSLALGLKEKAGLEVYGFDVSESALKWAESAGVIHQGHTDLKSAVANADLVVIAVPVGTTPRLMEQLAELPLKSDCIVTDVGSTKAVVTKAGTVFSSRGVTFIGGHPMAGSHRSGVQAADPHLFENAYYVLTPHQETSLFQVQRLSRLLEKATGAKLVLMDPEHHDRVVGAISHLPHVVAAALVNQVGRYNEENEWFFRLAAGGFRDLTRVAGSHPLMWRDILLSNRDAVVQLLDDWIRDMQEIQSAVRHRDSERIEWFFQNAKTLRDELPDRKKGILTEEYDCYVNMPDHPGEIGKVATLVGEAGCNLSNLHVMENREATQGVLRLVFRDRGELERAVNRLRQSGYEVFLIEEENQ